MNNPLRIDLRGIPESAKARFWARVVKAESGCWIWTGCVKRGYGQFYHAGKNHRAHAFAYCITKGEIPKGQEACHKCDVRSCVNPDHIFIGTRFDNMKDASKKGRIANQKKTHCKRGHPLSGDNLLTTKRTNWRRCRICNKLYHSVAPRDGKKKS